MGMFFLLRGSGWDLAKLESWTSLCCSHLRVRVGIPAVLMGECGCGKTELVKYLCAWLGVELLILNVHGGTTEADIHAIFQEAFERLRTGATPEVPRVP